MSRCLHSFVKCRIPSLQALVFGSLVVAILSPAWADDAADAMVNKAIKAMGGEARLAKARATTSKIKGTDQFTIEQTTDGLDRMRTTGEVDIGGGNKSTVVIVINGDKGWIKALGVVMEMEKEQLEDNKWSSFSESTALMLISLKGKDLKSVGDEKVGDKPAAGVKVTGPYDKDFTIYFDKESGLPVKVVADLPDRQFVGLDFVSEKYFSDYKDFGGIKLPKKVEIKRYGNTSTMELVDFKVLNKVDDKMFVKPE